MSNILREEQKFFDRIEFDPPEGYRALNWKDQKILHIHTHLGKIVGRKILDWVSIDNQRPLSEKAEDTIMHEVIPDLAIYRTQLVNLIGLEHPILDSIPQIPELETVSVRSYAYKKAASALGALSDYLEPKMHGEDNESSYIGWAAIELHEAVHAAAAHYWEEDGVEQLHRERMEQLMGRVFGGGEVA